MEGLVFQSTYKTFQGQPQIHIFSFDDVLIKRVVIAFVSAMYALGFLYRSCFTTHLVID